jgi:hypothetical protein
MALCLTLKKLNDGLAKKGEYIPEYMENLAKLCITLGSNPIEPRQGLSEKDQKIYQNNMKNLYLKKARALYQTLNETYRGNKNWENGRKAVDVLIRFNDKSSDVCDRTKRIVQNTLPSLRREIIESPENINAISALASLLRTEVAVSKREAPQLELALLKELLPYEQLLANSDPTNKTLQENYNTSKDRIEALTKPKGFTDRIKSASVQYTRRTCCNTS